MNYKHILFASLLLLASCTVSHHAYIPVSEGGTIYCQWQGKGSPVVLLHGHTLDMRMWQPQMKALSKHHRVIRLDMRGYGRSSKQSEGLHFTHTDDVMAVMDALQLQQFHLVGLSMGSFVASEIVALHPQRLLTATLASGNIRKRPGPHTPIDSVEWQKQEDEIAANRAKGIQQWKTDWIEQLISGGGSQAERIRKSLTQQVNDWDGYLLTHHEGRIYYADEAWDTLRLHRPTMPVLIISGEMEHKSPRNAMLPYLPQGRQVVIPDCGHMTNMERPDEFNALVLEHIASDY